ncbi:tetratricopeptide repeat protein [Atopobacter phocae]|uniref:tetratricopeptide repeat protein n=1 Tax=Atopobacter phocae TaxID=136492 RepID=UPI00047202DA|nr:hypothetical protein [Atopobacter phocae]
MFFNQINQFISDNEWDQLNLYIMKHLDEIAQLSFDKCYEIIEILLHYDYRLQVRDLLIKYIELNPQSTYKEEMTILLATILHSLMENDEALSYLYQINQTSDAYYDRLMIEASIYESEGDIEMSQYKLLQAQDRLPNLENELSIIEGNLMMGYYEKVEKGLDEFKRHFSNEIDSKIKDQYYILLSQLEEIYQDIEGAIQSIEKVSMQSQTELLKLRLVNLYLELNNLTQAKEKLKDFPSSNVKTRLEAKISMKENDWTHAMTLLKPIVKQDVTDIEAAFLLIQVYKKERLYVQAIDVAENAISVHPHVEHLNREYIELLRELEAYDKIISLNEDLKYPFKDEPWFLWALALAYQEEEKNVIETKQMFESAYFSFKGYPSFIKDYAHFLREIGDKAQLKILLETAKQDDVFSSDLDYLEEYLYDTF